MQQDLEQWLRYYNEERTHSGKYCYGKTPMQTFIDNVYLAKEKRIDELLEKDFNFNKSEEAEAGSAEEQPARNILTDEIIKRLFKTQPLLTNYFYRKCLKKPALNLTGCQIK